MKLIGPGGILSPETATFINTLSPAPPVADWRVSDFRTGPGPLDGMDTTFGADTLSENHLIPGRNGDIPIRIYRPADCTEMLRPIVYIHGGCWVFCDLDSHDPICRHLAAASGHPVVSIGYRLAPEAPFPAALHDSIDTCMWLKEHGATHDLDGSGLLVCGDSAGGNLAAVTAQHFCHSPLTILGQILVYPITNAADRNYDSCRNFSDGYFISEELLAWTRAHYLDGADAADPRVSPINAPDLSGLPPTLVITAEFDPLRDEGEAYAAALTAAGVPTTCIRYNGMIHAFVAMAGTVSQGADALDVCADFSRECLTLQSPGDGQ